MVPKSLILGLLQKYNRLGKEQNTERDGMGGGGGGRLCLFSQKKTGSWVLLLSLVRSVVFSLLGPFWFWFFFLSGTDNSVLNPWLGLSVLVLSMAFALEVFQVYLHKKHWEMAFYWGCGCWVRLIAGSYLGIRGGRSKPGTYNYLRRPGSSRCLFEVSTRRRRKGTDWSEQTWVLPTDLGKVR